MNSITCEQKDGIRVSAGNCACPFGCEATNVCTASFSLMTLKLQTQQTYCATDNYDDCPLFLARILRRRG